jgi:LacI family transcriptional regulator
MSKKVTIKDVAAAAGVSHQTVSRVMNNRPDVAKETRRRVRQVIEELDYQPSAIARSLSRQHSHTLGVVTAGLKYIGPSRTLNGIAEQAEELGYGLLLKELPSFNANDIKPILNFLVSRQVDGIIWAVAEIGENHEHLHKLHKELSIPMVFLTMSSREDMFIVAVDNYLGGRKATEHLLEQGCRHIGHISGPLSWWESRQRKAGWHDTLLEAGIPIEEHRWQEGDWSSASGQQAMLKILESFSQMDAVFIANDQMALGALQLACQNGINVPEDIAVVGFDNLPESQYFWPPLTTIRQNLRQLGGTAVSELVRIIEAVRLDEEVLQPKVVTLCPELVVRKSSIKNPSA